MPRERSPEAVTAGLEGHRNAADGMAGLDGLVAPAMKQRQQPLRIGRLFLERLAQHAERKVKDAKGCREQYPD
jgi:hypothetical protein